MHDLMEFLLLILIFKRDLQGVRAHNESGRGCFEKRFGKTLFKLGLEYTTVHLVHILKN